MSSHKIPLWQHVAVPVFGALLALLAYEGYTAVAPTLKAYVIPPGFWNETPRGETDLNAKEKVSREGRLDARASAAAQRIASMQTLIAAQVTSSRRAVPVRHVAQATSASSRRSGSRSSVASAQAVSSVVSSSIRASSSARAGATADTPSRLPSSGPVALLAVGVALGGAWQLRRRKS